MSRGRQNTHANSRCHHTRSSIEYGFEALRELAAVIWRLAEAWCGISWLAKSPCFICCGDRRFTISLGARNKRRRWRVIKTPASSTPNGQRKEGYYLKPSTGCRNVNVKRRFLLGILGILRWFQNTSCRNICVMANNAIELMAAVHLVTVACRRADDDWLKS